MEAMATILARLEERFTAAERARQSAAADHAAWRHGVDERLDAILREAKITNGRVSRLEQLRDSDAAVAAAVVVERERVAARDEAGIPGTFRALVRGSLVDLAKLGAVAGLVYLATH